jgi:hypothetical protein
MTVFSSPTFLAYSRPTKARLFVEFLRDRANAGESVPGFIYSLATSSPSNADSVAQNLTPAAPVVLFSPDIDLLPHPRTPKRAIYSFTETKNIPAIDASPAKAAGWLQDIVRSQVDLQASAVITPSLLLDSNQGETELRQILEWAARARQTPEAKDEEFLTGLALHREWVTKPTKRELLLNTLTDVEDQGFYVVVRWEAPVRGDQQLANKEGLQGLAEVAAVLRDEDREVVFARTGLAGWTLMSLGASGFSASPYAAHVLRDPVRFGRRKGSPSIPRVPLYLDRLLLSYVPFARMSAVNQVSGIASCPCPECTVLASGYAERPAFRHYLGALADLSEKTASNSNPRAFALREVNAAQALLVSAPGLGLPARTTAHLPVWESLLT